MLFQRQFITLLVLLFTLVLTAPPARAESGTQLPARLDTQAHVGMDYLIYLPEDYDAGEKWPLMLFLHGGGERGKDLDDVKQNGPPKLVAEGKDFPFLIVSPQQKADGWWQPTELMALLDKIEQQYRVDADRIYVTGLSLGGLGTWRLANYAPHRFAAIAPICGGGEV